MKLNFVLITLLLVASDGIAQQKPTAPKVPVVLTQAQIQDVPVWLKAVAQVKSQQSVEIRPQIAGVLQQVLVQEGDQVKAGQLLAVLDDRAPKAALAQAKAQLALVKAKADVAKRDLARFVNLSQSQAISAQQKDQQQALVQQLLAEVASVEAAIAAEQVQVSFTQIHSPVNGQVGIRNIDVGNYVRPSDSLGLFSVIQQSPISVEMALPQSTIPQLQALMTAESRQLAPAKAFAQDGKPEPLASGHLTVIDNRVSAGSGTIRVKADFANTDMALWPGQTVILAIQSKVLSQAVTIAAKALQQGPEGPFVWTVADDRAKPTPVKVLSTHDNIIVVEGIESGTQVVLDGQSRLRPGSTVVESKPSQVAAKGEPQ